MADTCLMRATLSNNKDRVRIEVSGVRARAASGRVRSETGALGGYAEDVDVATLVKAKGGLYSC